MKIRFDEKKLGWVLNFKILGTTGREAWGREPRYDIMFKGKRIAEKTPNVINRIT